MRPPSSQWIPTKLTSSPISSYSTPASVSIPLQLFFGITFDRTLSFSKHVSLMKAKFFPCLLDSCCISASSWSPSKESLSFLYKAFHRPFSIITGQQKIFFQKSLHVKMILEYIKVPEPKYVLSFSNWF